MKKILSIIVLFLIPVIFMSVGAQHVDEKTADAMDQFDKVMAKIKGLPETIDDDICAMDWASYRVHMTELAQHILEANTYIKDVQLYYPIDLWSVYNRISNNPVCGAGRQAASVFNVADISRVSNEEKMDLRQNSSLCMCWNIATGREEPTGYWKDGACRCTYGVNAYSPNIGRN